MAGKNIKGITIEFAADSSQLTQALKDADSSARKAQSSLRQINQALKFDPGNVTLLKNKQVELNNVIDQTKTKLNAYNQELEAMKAAGMNENDQHFRDIQNEIVKCESQLKSYNKALRETEAQMSTFGQLGTKFSAVGSKISDLGKKMQVVSGIAAGLVTSVAAISYSTAQWADDLNTLSKVTGISTEQLQIYAAAAELVDVSTETIAKSVARMKKNMLSASQGTGQAAKAFEQLGVKVTDSEGKLRNQDDVFQETLKALGEMTNETERDALAMAIFGKSAADLNPLIEDMGQTYKMVADEFAEGGLDPLDQETLDKANEFNDDVDLMKAKLGQAKQILGAGLADAFGKDVEKLSEWIGKLAEKIAGMNPHVLKVITIVASVVAVLAPLLIVIGGVASGIGALFTAISGLGPAFTAVTTAAKALFGVLSANPIILIVAAVVALVAALVKAYKEGGKFKEVIDNLWASIKKLGTGIGNFAKNAIAKLTAAFNKVKSIGQSIVSGLWEGIGQKFQWLVGKLKSFCNNVTDKLKSFFGIHSPSRVMRDQVGKNIALGIAEGISDATASVLSSIRDLAKATLNAATVSFEENTFSDALKNSTENLEQSLQTYTTNSISTVTKLINTQVKSASKGLDDSGKKGMAKAGKSMIKAYTDAIKEYSSTAKELLAATLNDLSQEFETKYNELVAKQQALESKLKDYGDLFTIDESGQMVINDINAQTAAITSYFDKLVTIKGLVNEELFNAISQLSIDQGTEFVTQLLNMAPAELEAYNNAYLEKIKLSEEMSKNLFANDLEKLKNDYTDAIDKTLGDVSTQMNQIGVDAMAGFISGMSSQTSSLISVARGIAQSVISAMKDELDINSPSKVMEKLIGSNVVKGLAKGITDNSYLVSDAMYSLIPDNKSILSSFSEEMSNAVSTGLALSNSGPNQFGGTIVVNLGGAKVAEQVFKLNKQGAVALQG